MNPPELKNLNIDWDKLSHEDQQKIFAAFEEHKDHFYNQAFELNIFDDQGYRLSFDSLLSSIPDKEQNG